MAISTSGFFGKYSTELGNAEVGIPYMQPYSFNNENSPTTVLPALSFATILEDKGNFDMTSKMKYEGTSFMVGSDLGRDYFLFSVHSTTSLRTAMNVDCPRYRTSASGRFACFYPAVHV